MALSLPFTMRDITNELGLGAGTRTAAEIAAATINSCSPVIPDQSTPWDMSSWDGYDHSRGPAKPSSISGNPGSSVGGTGDPTQDSHVFMVIGGIGIICADRYDVARAATSGGAKTIIGPDQAGFSYVYNHGLVDSPAGFFYIRGVSLGGNHGTWSDELELRTAPRVPQGVGSYDNFNCLATVITVTWNNGTVPGLRDSVVKWRWRLNGGAWSTPFSSTASGATQFQLNAGAVNDDDLFDFELRYDEEVSISTKSHTIICPI